MRRLPSVVLITSTLLASAVAITPTPVAAATPNPAPATPDNLANTETSKQISFAVGSGDALSLTLAGGATVTMTGPTEAPTAGTTFDGTSVAIDPIGGTVKATFDLEPASALPAAPGTYTVEITANGASTPKDTSTVTVTNTPPVTTDSITIPAGETNLPFTVHATSGNFAAGDTLTVTHSGNPASGISLSNVELSPTAASGKISVTRAVTPASYDITVTHTAGDPTVLTNCVVVQDGTGSVTNIVASSISHTSASLSWTAPTTGPQPPTGYQVFVSTEPDPTKNDTGITVTHSGIENTAAVSGLSPGTKYFVSVVTTTIAGPGDPTPYTFFTSEPSALALLSTDLHLKYGQKLTLSGHLTSSNGSVRNQPVVLYGKVGTAAAHAFKTLTTDSSGDFSYTFVPPHNATYFAAFLGAAGTSSSPTIDPTQSGRLSGTVAQTVTLVGAAVHHFRWLQLSGKVAPSAAHRTVVIYNKKNGHLHKYASAVLSSSSTYKIVLKHVKSGRYRLIAKIAATSLNRAGRSKVLPVLKP